VSFGSFVFCPSHLAGTVAYPVSDWFTKQIEINRKLYVLLVEGRVSVLRQYSPFWYPQV
jgi:hypothetical protein